MGNKELKLVDNITDIKENINTLNYYLDQGTPKEKSWVVDLFYNGRNFMPVKMKSGYRFYPSRFIGYKKNNLTRHDNSMVKDGRITSPRISELHSPFVTNTLYSLYEKEYEKFLQTIDREPTKHNRKYWPEI